MKTNINPGSSGNHAQTSTAERQNQIPINHMKTTTKKSGRSGILHRAALTLMLGMTAFIVSGQNIQTKQSSASSNARERTIAGVWRTVVTPRNCQTGAPVAPSLRGLFTFNEGGTMSEWGVGAGSSPALRSPGHGVWQREQGWQHYSYAFTYYRYDASGVFIGSQKVTATLVLGESGDEFTTNSEIESFDANDTLIGTVCGTTAGTRL